MLLKYKTSFFQLLKTNILFILLILGVILGFLAGFFCNDSVQKSTDPTSKELAMFISFPGELFLRMLRLLILPFVVSSVITSLATLDKKSAAKLGKVAFICFLATTFVAVIIAVIIATAFLKPTVDESHELEEINRSSALHSILDMLRNMIPDNIVEASFSSTSTKHKSIPTAYVFENKSTDDLKSSAKNMSTFLKNEVVNILSISGDNVQVIKGQDVIFEYDGQEKYNSGNILGVLTLSVVCGVILHSLGEKGKPIVSWFDCLFNVILKMVDLFMWFSPIGIGSIVAGELVAMKNINGQVSSLGIYIAMVVIISLIHSLVVLPVIYFMILRRNPFLLLSRVAKALLTAFGTASSSACIPITLNCLERNHKVDSRVTQFVLPIGTTVNKDGTAIYIAVAAIYVMKIYHGDACNFTSLILICFAATIASVAAAPITGSVPIATTTIVMPVIGISSADIALIIAVDWLMDRITTPTNVWACCVACTVVEHLSRNQLEPTDDLNSTSGTACLDVSSNTNSVAIDIIEEGESMEDKQDMKNITNISISVRKIKESQGIENIP